MSYGRPQQSKAQNDANAKTLRALVKHPDNKTCADCTRDGPLGISDATCAFDARAFTAVWALIKSIDLDIWTPEQMEAIQKWGNRRCNLYWEAHLKPGHVPPDHKIESFIRSKYELRRWAREGPVPDPATLDPAASEPQAAAAAPTAGTSTASSRNTAPPAAQPSNNGGGGILDLLDDPVPSAAAAGAPKPSASAVATKSPVAPAQTSSGSGLFDLDWSSAPTTASAGGGGAAAATTTTSPTSAGGPKGKDDILSLFSAPRPSIPSAGGAASASGAGAGGFGALNASFSGLNMGGGASNGASATPAAGGLAGLDASNPWGAPAGGASAQRSNSLFDSQDVWGAAKPAAGAGAGAGGFGDIWGSSGSASQTGTTSTTTGAAAAKKDDAFADIWGDFK
ncbi:hypothetical protein A4X09_0g1330 [Tilletia walkeri]|uniref:Arf-GAP domain-containing protein n=1 Tax=Tilletia walkeri TaxID=117179 RepID=A0A8X7NC25_9BASI|nr:hypothetical protein A4X09_0g1330 [Tilletia walkeri]